MSTTYSSYLSVVVTIDETDVIEEVTTTVVLCDHPHKAKFCPECGAKSTERERPETRKQFTKPFAHLTRHLDVDVYGDPDDDDCPDEDIQEEPDLDLLINEWDGDVELGAKLKLSRLTTSGYHQEGAPLVLSALISKVGGYGDGWHDIDVDKITDTVDAVRKALLDIGMETEPRVVHLMYAG